MCSSDLDKIVKTTSTGRGYLSDEIIIKPKQREYSYEVGEDIIQSKQSEFLTFSLGLYKFMLLTLGITDTPTMYSDKFTDFEEEYQVRLQEEKLTDMMSHAVIQFHNYIEQDAQNSWHSTYFSKEKFLQYAIVQLLKEDPELYEEAKMINDFYFRDRKSVV